LVSKAHLSHQSPSSRQQLSQFSPPLVQQEIKNLAHHKLTTSSSQDKLNKS
jgi:hypothetical protein